MHAKPSELYLAHNTFYESVTCLHDEDNYDDDGDAVLSVLFVNFFFHMCSLMCLGTLMEHKEMG